MVGKAASFTMDDAVALSKNVPVDTGRPFTLASWVRPVGERIEIIHVLGKMENGRGFELLTEESYHIPDLKRGARLHFNMVSGPGNALRVRTREPLVYGTWTHLGLLWDGKALQLSVNGKPAELDILENTLNGPVANGAPLEIRGFRGGLDDLRIYTRTLSEQELSQLAIHGPAALLAQIAPAQRSNEEKARLREYYLTHVAAEPYRSEHVQLKKLERRLEAMERAVPNTMVMQEMNTPRETFVLARGDYRNKTEKVSAAVPSSLPPLPKDAPANRLGLAKWLVDETNPLTARVIVNRFWQMYFGIGIVKTSEDFGSQGEAPSHPELLDWLATEFVRSKWDVKAMQRMIVLSATYRQNSKVTPQMHERDPENRLLARMSRFRLPAEFVRDNALAVSGLLNEEIGGRSVYPYQPAGLWEEMAFHGTFSAQTYSPSKGQDLYRRSMYTFWKRTVPPASMVTFDAPDREKCASRRPVTNTPLQALALLNEPTYVEAARRLAEGMIREAGSKPEARIEYAYRRVLARKPAPREVAVLRDAASRQYSIYSSNPAKAEKLVKTGDSAPDAHLKPAEVAAWTNVATMILSLDEAITKE
jgi:hypothetical protein